MDLLSVRINQIYPTDLLSVRTNQISPTDLFPYQPIRSLLQTYIRTSQSDRSGGPTFHTSQSNRSVGPTFHTSHSDRLDGPILRTSQSDRSDGYHTVIHGHSLRSHPQDRTVRPSSLSRLRAKAVPCTHKPPRAHKSLTCKAIFNHTQ